MPPTTARVIDIHAHYYPEKYLALLAEDGKRPNGDDPRLTNLKLRLADMDRQGVALQALSLTAPMVYWGGPDRSHELARTWNDAASIAHQAHPTRFVVLVALPMLHADRALAELDRARTLPGVRGVYMGTNIDGRDLDDPMFAPVFARIEELGLPLFLHPITPVGGARLAPYFLSNLVGNPVDGTIAACHLIFGGVLDRHPNLQVCLPHAGGVLPMLIGRMDRGWRVRPELRHLAKAPSTYLERFTYDTIGHSKAVLEFAIRQVGAERVMVGSDYCLDMGYEEPVDVVAELDITSAQREMIFSGTATRLLKL